MPLKISDYRPAFFIPERMLRVNRYDQHVAARLLDFFDVRTAWHRLLWTLGLPLLLREVLEASEAQRAGVLGPPALKFLCDSAMTLAGRDPGAGSKEQRRSLQDTLKAGVRFEGLDFRAVEQILGDIEHRYLERWSAAVADEARRPGPERAARCIGAYLLDMGISSDFLHRWWSFRIKHQPGERSLAELINDAHGLARSGLQEHNVLVAFERIARTKDIFPCGWMEAPDVARWLKENGAKRTDVRQHGGMILKVKARDPVAAVERAREILDKLAARVSLSLEGEFKPLNQAWVKGETEPIPLRTRPRNVRVNALQREKKVYSDTKPGIVDAAIELISALASSSPGPAVASGWAALEAILSEPSDRGCAAERMATLVACSFPRAELTLLSYTVERLGNPLGSELARCTSNRDRCHVLASAILHGDSIALENESDKAALARMQALLNDPPTVIHDIQAHVASAFRRLYRQRNLVLHWGRTDAAALRATLRTVSPLVGAGMDRIAHAWFVDGVEPIPLVAKARWRLANLTRGSGVAAVDLLS